jgi:outer membrane protein
MNASAKHITRLVALTMLMPCLAWSAGFDILPPIDDPLGTRSAMPKNAVMLPGDTMQAPCGGGAHTVGATLGVVEVVDLTMCNNPRLRDAWAVVKQQASALGEARSAYLPTLSLNLNRLRTETQYEGGHTGVTGNTLYGSMNWQILDFGTRAASVRAAVYLLESALANNDATLQKSLADTIQAYFDVQSTRAAWQAKQLSVATAAATLASTERRESNGTLARSDRLQAATALARAELDQNRAQGNYVKATALLVYAMGLPPSADVTFKEEHEDQEESSASVQLDRLDQWLRAAEQSHPAIRAARAEWASAQSLGTLGSRAYREHANRWGNGKRLPQRLSRTRHLHGFVASSHDWRRDQHPIIRWLCAFV